MSICTDELISAPKHYYIGTKPTPIPSDNEKLLHASNPLPYSENLYLSGSAFYTNLGAPNKKFPNANQYHQT